jgi:hypothetical protein
MVENPHGLLVDPPLELRPFVAGGRITAMPARPAAPSVSAAS